MLFVRFRSAISTSPVRVAQVGQEYSADEVELVAETKGNEVKVSVNVLMTVRFQARLFR